MIKSCPKAPQCVEWPKPNPDCRWCRGTGEVLLVVTVVPCDCLKSPEIAHDEEEIRLADEDDGLGTTDTGCHI